VTIEVGILVSVLGVIIAYQGYQLNKQKQVKNDTQESAELKAELGYIRRGVDNIQIDLKANEKQIIALGERVTRVEESSKQAHKRIDAIEKEVN
jgi:septal ring factor EnvC (AmiA/AmiB activator)